jgi:EAL domain-containing protein (putative c-di-GMP-specific phosphodiesterase class I)
VADPRNRSLLRLIARFCADHRISTVAEMIEDEYQARELAGMDIDMGQGYLFGRPAPLAAASGRRDIPQKIWA